MFDYSRSPRQSLHLERIRPCSQISPPPHSLHRERTRPKLQTDAPPHSFCTESADDRARRLRPTALLALRAYTTGCSQIGAPTALLAVRAPTIVLADLRPTALLALRAPLPVRTSAAHLAFRPRLHPVLARPLRARGSLPLRPLLRHLLSPLPCPRLRHTRRGHSHVRPPDRRLHRHELARPSGRETSSEILLS